ncbi:MAG: hypothetical protein ACK5Q5_12505 [Planctomycetaceae bacterium]
MSTGVMERLGPAKKFSHVQFHVKDGASLKLVDDRPPIDEEVGATLVYLTSVPLADGGRVLAAFGMGGVETMLWSQVLAKRCKLLKEFAEETHATRFHISLLRVPKDIKYPWYEHSASELRWTEIADIRL